MQVGGGGASGKRAMRTQTGSGEFSNPFEFQKYPQALTAGSSFAGPSRYPCCSDLFTLRFLLPAGFA